MYIDLTTKCAGKFTILIGNVCIHILPDKDNRQWGYVQDWYDGYLYSFGFGPIVLFTWFFT